MQSVGGNPIRPNLPPNRPSAPVSPPVANLLSNQPTLQGILSALGYAPSDILSVQKKDGPPETFNSQIFVKETTQSMTHTLSLLGLDSAVVAMVSSDVPATRLKKRLRKISQDLYDWEVLEELSQLLGFTIPEDALLFEDKEGGVLLIQTGINDVLSDVDNN